MNTYLGASMSGRFRTHYDNLMVSRTAPHEVIAAAYRALSKQIHPDQNPNDPRAEAVMRIVNSSYHVLSDPVRRRAHDEWIKTQEASNASSSSAENQRHSASPAALQQWHLNIWPHIGRHWLIYLCIGLIGFAFAMDTNAPAPSGLPNYVENPTSEMVEGINSVDVTPDGTSTYVRPINAPNGNGWPNKPAYIHGYPIARVDGLSKLTIDNGTNDSDMFVKLVALDSDKSLPVRHAFIPAHEAFTMNKVKAGQYDVRYMDLSDGGLSRSEAFNLEEIHEPQGVRFSVTTMTLYKVANGNMQTYALSPTEF
jgi:DnaJ domain